MGFIALKENHDQGNSYNGKHLLGAWLTVPEVCSVIVMAGHMAVSVQTDMVLEERIVLHLDLKAARRLDSTLGRA